MNDRDTESPALLKSKNTEKTCHKRQELSVPVIYASEIGNIPLCEPQIQEHMKYRENVEVTTETNYRNAFEVKNHTTPKMSHSKK